MQNKNIILGLGIILAFIACNTSKPVVVEEVKSATITETLTSTQAKGKALYTANCGRCHALPERNNYSPEAWTKYVEGMIPKAKITNPEDIAAIKAYAYK